MIDTAEHTHANCEDCGMPSAALKDTIAGLLCPSCFQRFIGAARSLAKYAKAAMSRHSKPATAPILLSVYDAGAKLGLSPWTIRNWAYTGKIASHKIGKRLMVPQDAIDKLLTESLRPAKAGAR